MRFASIAICTYGRLDHLRKTVDALKLNVLAQESELYIFSDAPRPGDEAIVRKVREYIRTVDGFKKVHIVERAENGRVKNCRGGMRQLLNDYGRCILLEDDIITAKGFLLFMNEALRLYADNKEILSISGYAPPLEIPSDYSADAYLLRRFCGWGAGLWKDKCDLIKKIDYDELKAIMADKIDRKRLKDAGEDLLPMMMMDARGDIDALDVKAMYLQFVKNMYTVYPRRSLARNIGHDGSGVHCGATSKFEVDLWDAVEFGLSPEIFVDERIARSNEKFRRLDFWKRLRIGSSRLSNRLGVSSFLTPIRKG